MILLRKLREVWHAYFASAECPYRERQKVRFIPAGEIYEFGYVGTGKYIVYEPGECNMQDKLEAA